MLVQVLWDIGSGPRSVVGAVMCWCSHMGGARLALYVLNLERKVERNVEDIERVVERNVEDIGLNVTLCGLRKLN